MRQNFRRVPVVRQAQQQMKHHTFVAPTRGWVVNENLATAQPGGAKILQNWFPTQKGARVRGGSLKKATISTGPVLSQWTYKVGTTEKHFAADQANIFDITSPASPTVIPAAAVSGQTSGYYSTAQIGTVGGNYLYAVNGTDSARLYDGASWTAVTGVSSPAITGVTTSTLSFVWTFANRLFFVKKGTMSAWYLPVDSIGGAAQEFSLSGIFQKGGQLLFGGTWSMDAGDGLDDKCVFVSSEGEVAVYQGTDPSSADSWAKVGVYSVGAPLGVKGTMRAGGDFLIATVAGVVPLSEAVNKDAAALSLSAVTRNIAPAWVDEAQARRSMPWEIIKVSNLNMGVVSLPVTSEDQAAVCYVVNLETGGWAEYTGWNARCLAEFGGNGFFGTNTGTVHQMEATGADDGLPYTCIYVGQFDHVRQVGPVKMVHSARTTFLIGSPINPQVSVSTNYQVRLPTSPNSPDNYSVDEWDVGLWDEALWDAGGVELSTSTRWTSIGRSGYVIAPQIQMTFGITPLPRAEIVSYEITYEPGAIVV